jgi:hypothetical protein
VTNDVIANLGRQCDVLKSLDHIDDEYEQFLLTWEISLITLSREAGAAALTVGVTSHLRAARILNRSIVEYTYRLHYYAKYPEESKRFGEQYGNFVRHVMRPWADYQGRMTKAAFKAYRKIRHRRTYRL